MRIIILGNGGHSKVIQDMISSLKNHEILAVLDEKYTDEKQENGIIYAPISYLQKFLDDDVKVVIAVGDNKIRKQIVYTINLKNEKYVTVVHPSAIVSSSSKIGNGTVVMPNAIINADATIGEHCIINTGAIIEHDNNIGHYTHLSPNTTLTGNVLVEEGAHIGASATIIPGIKVGNWSIVGAGSTVIHHIPSYSTAVGSPARIIKNIDLGIEIS
ncbi:MULTISPECIES: acetyltransferase [Gottfriedia]|uniref:Putative acetyltransferase EpsM n=1 Tax=Gottfriedia solisilvae TaxID=1516104 RepID=A0A8J3F4E8_9BACI|nr:acetyltransferase [Gottfriedia solisilvae]GGI16656.1 putative acetyltransferase EpsM [Gottfriedia solisilvae]